MTRLEEIEARLKAAKSHAAPALMMPTSELEYLLQELQKRDAADRQCMRQGPPGPPRK